MEKIRAAVIGCGNISVMHSDSIAALDEAELVAVCDVKKERAEAAAKIYIETVKIQKIISDIYNNNDTRDWYVGCL